MDVIKTELEGVYVIEPKIFRDGRGYFRKFDTLKSEKS